MINSPLSILVVDDEAGMRDLMSEAIISQGDRVTTASNAAEALSKIEQNVPDAVITDLRMPGMDGFQLFQTIRRLHEKLPVVIMSAYGTIETAVESVKCGVFDYLPKPFSMKRVANLLASLHSAQTLNDASDDSQTSKALELVGQSQAMVNVRDYIKRAARFDSTVFLQGEGGTGKEWVARAIHNQCERQNEDFNVLSCEAKGPDFVERELFGFDPEDILMNERKQIGLLESTGAGTLFLEEISEIPTRVQASLLRALQDGEFRPVGSNRLVPLKARLIVATRQDLNQAVQNGQFRKDLFYRLHILPIHLPPLRVRQDDISLLIEYFVGRLSLRGIEAKSFTPGALAQMVSYHWPGNVRELENSVERALIMAEGQEVQREDLPNEVKRKMSSSDRNEPAIGCRLKDYEHAAVVNALRISKGNKRQAARILEISIATLYKKIREYNIEV